MKLRMLFLSSALAVSALTANAQKFYEFVFCNTLDSKIGETCALDEERIVSEIGGIAESIGYEPVERMFHGEDCSKETLLNELTNLQCSSRDVVLFYYSGHGVHSNAGLDDKFPQMCLKYAPKDQEKFVPVRKVEELISAKKPRLAIILSDCCNNIDESGWITSKGLTEARGVHIMTRDAVNNYRKLFAESEGIVVATGCKLGQTSLCTMQNRIGGFFTFEFCQQIDKMCKGTGTVTWSNLLSNVKAEVAKQTQNEQEPYYVSNIKQEGGSGNGGGGNVTPTPPPPAANFSTFQEALESLLRTNDMTVRRNMLPRIKQRCFSGKNATIVTLGRNLTTVVDYEELDAYLNRLATNKKIIRISVLKDETDSMGKRFITVTETRIE